eukprot:1176822-Prorocentrum_minimum.AAC.1
MYPVRSGRRSDDTVAKRRETLGGYEHDSPYRRETLIISDYQHSYRRPEGATRTLSQVALAQRDAWNSRRSDDTVAKRRETLGGYEQSSIPPTRHLGSSLRASGRHKAGMGRA